MTRDEFIDWLESVGAHYESNNEMNPEAVYVHGKPQKTYYEILGEVRESTPYIRVSRFGSEKLYIRNNGFCHHVTENVLKEEILCNYIW